MVYPIAHHKTNMGSISVMDPTDDSIFTAGLDDVTTMSKILQELHHEEHSVLVITRHGLRLITAGEKIFQVSAFFAASAFQRFKFDHENHYEINFRFILKDFIECLNLLRDDPISEGDKIQLDDGQPNEFMKTSLYIQYRKKGEPLKLRLENKSNYVINCDVRGFSMGSETMFCPLAFSETEETAVIVLNSKKLYEYVSGLDLTSSDLVHIVMGRGETPLRLSTSSMLLGEVELEISYNAVEIIKRDIVVSDHCLYSFSYKTQFIKPALEALRSSSYMQMKCGSNGLLCIEHFHDDSGRRQNGSFLRTDSAFGRSSQHSYNDILSDYNQPQNKRSSVEYFILSEAKSIDACLD